MCLEEIFMKKCFLALVLVIMTTGAAFALDVAVGGGALFDYSFRNGIEGSNDDYIGFRRMGIGGVVFLDFRYVELEASFGYGSLKWVFNSTEGDDTWSEGDKMLELGLGIILKFPFALSKMVVYPFVGANYLATVSWESDYRDKSKKSDLNQIGCVVGGGFDNYITNNVFVRVEAGLNIRLFPRYWSNRAKTNDYYDATIGIGPRIKAAVGVRL